MYVFMAWHVVSGNVMYLSNLYGMSYPKWHCYVPLYGSAMHLSMIWLVLSSAAMHLSMVWHVVSGNVM